MTSPFDQILVEDQEPGGWSLEQMSPAQVASLERVHALLSGAGWELEQPAPPWRNRFAMTPEIRAEYHANPTWWIGLGWYMSREYVLLQLKPREVGGDPVPGQALTFRAYPPGDPFDTVEHIVRAVIERQDSLQERDWHRLAEAIKPLCSPLLFEVPGGFLVS